jgi:iron complex outermembrane receptor protein
MEQIAVGEANSTGFEFDVSGQVTEKLGVIGSYAYTDSEITKDNSGNENNRLPNVPEHAGSFWAKYDLTTQLSIGTGMFAAGEREVDNANTAQMPGYVRVDAMVAYRWRLAGSRITAQLNLQNLLDKKYYLASNLIREQILPGAPLTVLGSVRIEY